jgi:hypothetical protein
MKQAASRKTKDLFAAYFKVLSFWGGGGEVLGLLFELFTRLR